jgi:DeoR/GlpR family transcriptional regulator of sugar metabolism
MTAIHKIIAINHLYKNKLPNEITDLITDFVFYDIETQKIKLKLQKNQIHQTLLSGLYEKDGIFGDAGHWYLEIENAKPNNQKLCFQVTNCTKCGNYQISNNFHYEYYDFKGNQKLHDNIICWCYYH